MNINVTVNMLPVAELGDLEYDENDDLASIEDKIESEEEKEEKAMEIGPSYKFVNPSCFFSSMKKSY